MEGGQRRVHYHASDPRGHLALSPHGTPGRPFETDISYPSQSKHTLYSSTNSLSLVEGHFGGQ